ncbi:STAS domain-containing protein [Planctomicrobium piriforme]|uniref:Anti-anti-sigma factor n=1 Tax=Planctomicrobium piriforme TaxID=1576369 RepID=A0A1I3FFA8_9PLAN|nr:STAS domain-containing protein [Planctomicrobium piriforme]SFI09884.1 anti-anti-sigma factor [Planctomicrobium piriforme]
MAKPILEVYQTGPTTVVGFGGRDILGDVNVALCRNELLQLIEEQRCSVVAFDLTGVKFIPSGLLGLLASMRQNEIEVHLYNPSDDIREVLTITGLEKIMPVHRIEVPRPERD